ncbi:MAG: O-antigen ligase family protein [Bacteroidota bacterium]
MYLEQAIYIVLPLTLFLMQKKEMYEELFLGFLFILILSDSLEDYLYFAKNIKNIYILILAVFIFFDLNSFTPFNKLYKIFIPFFIFSFFTMCFSINDDFIFTSFQKTVSYILIFIIVPNFVTKLFREYEQEFLKRFILFVFTTLIAGLILKYIAPEVANLSLQRYRGVLGSPNGLGIYCVLTFMIFFVLTDFFPQLFNKKQQIIIYIAILCSIYLTGSRNAVLAILIFYFFQRFFGLSPFLGFILLLITLFVVEIISYNLTSIILSLGLGNFFRINTLEEGSGRYVAWQFAWQHIQHNFFIGKGFAYNEYFMRQNYDLLSKLKHQGGIHNSFLTFWMDQGLIGLLIYLRSYVMMFIRASEKTMYAFPIMFGILFSAMFESWLVGSLSAFAFLAMFIYTIITSEEIVPQNDEGIIVQNTKEAYTK